MGSFRFARRYSGNRISFFSSGYLDVSVPQVCLLISYVFRYGYHPIKDGGFPHSDIPASKLTYSSTRRFAVRRVLLRLLVPRHSPCALSNLTIDGRSPSHLFVNDFPRSCHVRVYAPFFRSIVSSIYLLRGSGACSDFPDVSHEVARREPIRLANALGFLPSIAFRGFAS